MRGAVFGVAAFVDGVQQPELAVGQPAKSSIKTKILVLMYASAPQKRERKKLYICNIGG